MENNIFNIRPISCLGCPLRKMFCSFWVSVAAVPTSIWRFFEWLALEMEFGFAVKYTIDLFTQKAIDMLEMLARIDELERKFNKS